MTLTTSLLPTTQRISLLEPLPGFPAFRDWTLDPIDTHGLLHSLRSLDEPDLRFVLTPCHAFFPGYDTGFAAAIGRSLDGDEVDVLLVLTVGSSLQTATANLRAPVVVARRSGRAVQVVLDDASLSMREPLVGAAA
jgi:flagellar assembly factor FliW